MLSRFAENVWTSDMPLRFAGVAVGARMTVVKLGDGRLLLHSPVKPNDELRAEVEKLGRPSLFLAPNKYHHLFIKPWMEAYPDAQAWAAPGLPKKRKDVAFAGVCEDGKAPWAPDVEHLCWRGSPAVNEVVLFHKPSRTLVSCDLVHNLGPDRPGFTRFVFGLMGGYGGVKTNLVDRLATRDRVAARASLERVLAWDFDRLIMSHGTPVETGAHAAIENAFAWLRK
jgi:hypothetical protein